MTAITALTAVEILDSRGQPTLQVGVTLSTGIHATAGVPSEASTGAHEAVELRDKEPERFSGRGVLAAVGSVRRQINDLLVGTPVDNLDFQEFMVAPIGSPSYAEGLRAGAEVYAALRQRAAAQRMPTALGDEGGFALPLDSPEAVLHLIVDAIEDAGYPTGPAGIMIALDPAANGFRTVDGYQVAGVAYTSSELVAWYDELTRAFPVWSIEDGLAEDDEEGWREITATLGERVQVVGDDLLVTDAETVRRAAAERLVNACLIKPNQAGNLERTLATVETCRSLGLAQMASHRSGETIDSFLADLAVGIGCGQLKSGAPARGERLAKYNRLLEIEHEAGLPYGLRDADVRR